MFVPSHAYQHANWRTSGGNQYLERSNNQQPKSLAIPSPSSHSEWPLPTIDTYQTSPSTCPPQYSQLPYTAATPVSYQSIPPRRPAPHPLSHVSSTLPPTNLRNVSLAYALPASMLVAPSKFDSPYEQRPTGNIFIEPQKRLASGPSVLSPYTNSGPAGLPLISSSLPSQFPFPTSEMARLNQPLQTFPGEALMYSMNYLTDTSDPWSDNLSTASASDYDRSTPFTGHSSPTLRPISKSYYPIPQTAILSGHNDRPIMRRNLIDLATGSRSDGHSGELRVKHGRKRFKLDPGEMPEEWETVLQRKERRKEQNRSAQRAFRARTKALKNSVTSGWSTNLPLVMAPVSSGDPMVDIERAIQGVEAQVEVKMEPTLA